MEAVETTNSPRSTGAAALVWRQVLEGIYEGRYTPGQRLTEAELTEEFSVGRSSVREALTKLAAEGVVELHRHRGAIVRSSGKAELLETLAVLSVLIPFSARLAALNIQHDWARKEAEKELSRLASPRETFTPFELARERNRFYRTLLTIAGNKELQRIMSLVHVHPLRVRLTRGLAPSAILADYIGILAAVLAGDAKQAEQAAQAHVRRNIAEVEKFSEPDV